MSSILNIGFKNNSAVKKDLTPAEIQDRKNLEKRIINAFNECIKSGNFETAAKFADAVGFNQKVCSDIKDVISFNETAKQLKKAKSPLFTIVDMVKTPEIKKIHYAMYKSIRKNFKANVVPTDMPINFRAIVLSVR